MGLYHSKKSQEIFEAILDDIEVAFVEHNWFALQDKCSELRAHVSPFLVSERAENGI